MFEIYDVGGQRNERRKWIHCFEGNKYKNIWNNYNNYHYFLELFYSLNIDILQLFQTFLLSSSFFNLENFNILSVFFGIFSSIFITHFFHIFIFLPGVSAVIFVASISEFDQILFEDSTTNRMVSTIQYNTIQARTLHAPTLFLLIFGIFLSFNLPIFH